MERDGLSFDVDVGQWAAALGHWPQLVHEELVAGLKEHAKEVLRQVILRTPPTLKGQADEELHFQRRALDARIDSQITALFLPVEPSKVRRHVKAGKVHVFTTKSGGVFFTTNDRYRPKASHREMRTWQNKHRKGKSFSPPVPGVISYGRIHLVRKMVVEKNTVRSYARELKSHVGYAKAGWKPAAQGLGLPLPSWIMRHNGAGHFQDNTHDRGNPRYVIANSVPYILDQAERILADTVHKLEPKFKKRTDHRMNRATRRSLLN